MIGYKTVETLIKNSEGKNVADEIVVPCRWYDINNVDEVNCE